MNLTVEVIFRGQPGAGGGFVADQTARTFSGCNESIAHLQQVPRLSQRVLHCPYIDVSL